MALDFPALERPANATSARLSAGQSEILAALVVNWVSLKSISFCCPYNNYVFNQTSTRDDDDLIRVISLFKL